MSFHATRTVRRGGLPFLLVLLAMPAAADVLRLRSGARIQGRIVEESPSSVTVDSAGGRVVVSRSTIASIERGPVPAPGAPPVTPPSVPSVSPALKPADPAPDGKPAEGQKPSAEKKPAEELKPDAPPGTPDAPKPVDAAAMKARIGGLMEAVGAPGGLTRESLATALSDLGPAAVPVLIEVLPGLETLDRLLPVVTAIAAAPTPEAGPAFRKLALSDEPGRRHVAAFGLGQIGTPEDIPLLGRLLADEVGYVRYSAREALVNIQVRRPGPESTREALRRLDDNRDEVRREIVALLAQLNRPEGAEALENEAGRAEGEARAPVWRAFAAMNDPRVASFFERRLRSESPSERRLALDAFACHRRATAVVPLLIERLDDPEPSIGATALQHLVRLSGKDLGADAGAWRAWWEGERVAVMEREQMRKE